MNDFPTPEYAAVQHILTVPSIAARTQPYIGEEGFDWAGLLTETETMSGGENILVRIAHDLWHAEGSVSLSALAERLSTTSFRRVVDALELCRGERPSSNVLERLDQAA